MVDSPPRLEKAAMRRVLRNNRREHVAALSDAVRATRHDMGTVGPDIVERYFLRG